MNDLNEDQKKALRAFKKRLKVTQLDDDSKLGRSPMSGNGQAKITAITPPTGFGRAVWEELAAKGYLRPDGGGFYELATWKDDK